MRTRLLLTLALTLGAATAAGCSEPPCERVQSCCDAMGDSLGGGELRQCETAASSGEDGQCTTYLDDLNEAAARIDGVELPEACVAD
ncbi:MAG TPA: hypothetical protein RMH99_25420 [Sandaracinaceae bacterium LLY-WYZ-13_1]|nr:hypothetical protein [Sandaracinaceae bacterium LLY-WYZ-13_1]